MVPLTVRQACILAGCVDARMDELLRLNSGRTVSRDYWGELVELAVGLRAMCGPEEVGSSIAASEAPDEDVGVSGF